MEAVKGVKYASMPPGMYKNSENMGGFLLSFWHKNG
jgi:hypothetical protein